MPWIIDRKPFLIFQIFGFVNFAHKIVGTINHLSHKYKKLIREQTYLREKLRFGSEIVKLENEINYVQFRTN